MDRSRLKNLGLITTIVLAMACGLAGAVSATTFEPANTAFTLTSTNSSFTVSGASTFSCTDSVLTGHTGALDHSTYAAATITAMAYSGCSMFGIAGVSVTPTESCSTGSGRPILRGMGIDSLTAIGILTLPIGCSIDIAIPSLGCTMTITGNQTIGNATAGSGGIAWTNLSTKSVANFNVATIPVIDIAAGGGFGCPTAGAHTGSLNGNYTVTSATNVTITSGSGTTIEPSNTAATLTSTNTTFIVDPDSNTVGCNDTIITGDSGSFAQTTWAALTITGQTYNNCMMNGFFVNVTPSEGCGTGSGRPTLHAMGVNTSTAINTLTLPATCSITIDVPITGCTMTVTGGQTIGNGTAGTGGIDWTNRSTGSIAHLNNADIPRIDSNGVGAFCPTAGTHTGTLASDLTVTSSPNITVTP